MKKILIVGLLAIGAAAFFAFDLNAYFSLTALQENRARLLAFTVNNYALAVAVFLVVYITQTAFSLPGGAVLTMTGGLLFGSIFGMLLVNISATLGATLAFLAARYVLRDWVEQKFGKRIAMVQRGFAENAFNYLLTLRLIPLFPFFLVNLVAGLTRIKIREYVIATALGILPGSFVFAYAGQQLGNIKSLREIVSPPVLLAFILLGALSLLPIAYQKLQARQRATKKRLPPKT